MKHSAWLIVLLAALLEVSGDALIRKGLHVRGGIFVAMGILVLGAYGVVVNTVKVGFFQTARYVAVFATVSVLCGRYVFRESVPPATWIGLIVIIAGGLIIQYGSAF